MNETGLIIAEVAFLALLYAFVWTVVRSSSRQLRAAQPPPAPRADDPAPAAPARAEAHVVPSPAVRAPAPPPPVAEAPDIADAPAKGARLDEPGGIELHGNLDPRLIVVRSDSVEAGRVFPLQEGMTIGRSEAAGLSLAGDAFASHMHARIVRRGAYHFVEDLGSTNGTFLNDRRIEQDAQLKVHDALRIGQTILRYEE